MKKVSGICIYYLHVCKKKLWYYLNDLGQENDNIDVEIGKELNKQSYDRYKKDILINGEICIDFIQGKRVCHEIKKSKKMEEASVSQLKYYLYVLKKSGASADYGVIDYPLLKKRVHVYLEDNDEEKIKDWILEIEEIYNQNIYELTEQKNICKKCAYYDLCKI